MIQTELFVDAFHCLRWRLVALLLLMVLAAAFEGFGLAMLFPVLTHFGIGQSGGGALQEMMIGALAALRIPDDLGVLLLIAVVLLLLQVLFQTMRAWFEADCQTRYTEYWQRRVFSSFMNAEWRFFTEGSVTDQVNAIVTEVIRVKGAFYLYAQMATATVFIVVYAAIAIASSWQLVAFIAVFGGLTYLAVRPISRKANAIGERIGQVNGALQNRSSEFLYGAKLIKVTASEDMARTQFDAAAREFREGYRLSAFHPKLVLGAYMAAGYLMLGVGLWVAITSLKVNPASILVSVYVSLRLYVQLTNLLQLRVGLLQSIPAFWKLRKEIATAEVHAERLHGGEMLPHTPAEISLTDITVRYGTSPALEQVSLCVRPGEMLGVTGSSGAGKSTLVDVVAGLIQPYEGTVCVDGVSMDRVALRDWRKSIGYVGQETVLLNDSIGANIAWGSQADAAAIEQAARTAQIHDFVSELPAGYDTRVGDRGVRLSGGQRQRLGLARALIGRKRLLILDEATSALDSESEQAITRAIAALHGSVTILVVAHRLSTLRDTSRIVVLERGQIVETGCFDELTGRDGVFGRLWQLQRHGAPAGVES
jgi:ATP-binding cassette subfamily C protein